MTLYVRMITKIVFIVFHWYAIYMSLGQGLPRDWVSALYRIEYADNGRSRDLRLHVISKANVLI